MIQLMMLVSLSLLLLTHQSPVSSGSATYLTASSLSTSSSASSTKYLISRSDVHEMLSKIIKPSDKIVLLSDFDGTLSDLIVNSNLSTIRTEAKAALDQLAFKSNFFVGFISGRGMFDLENRIGIDDCTYSGNHGLEILFPNNTAFYYPVMPEMARNRTKIRKIVENEYVSTYGGWIEDKNLTLSYHYDEIAESAKSLVVTEMSNIVRRHGYQPMTGHNVLEIKPPVVWTKGHAAQLILENAFGNKWEKKVHVLYMGDDTSDEDVMRMLKGRSTTTFRITSNPNLKTHATYKIKSVDTNIFILEWLVNNTQD